MKLCWNRQEVKQEKARRKLRNFIAYTMPEYNFNWHHEYMIERLQAFVEGRVNRLMVFMPPRHGKSQLVSRHAPAFIFGQNPDARIIACSYSADLASSMNRDVQRIMTSEEYVSLFPEARLNSKNVVTTQNWLRNSTIFEIVERKGYYVSAGVGGAITGKGADFAIIDDPVKNAEEAASPTYRQRHWDWYTSTLYTRLEKGGSVLLTLTRWHEDDLAGRLLALQEENADADRWEVISFPAVREDFKDKNDPREVGEPLWPDKYDKSRLDSIRSSVGSRVWSSLYQQRPAPDEGGLIKGRWFSWYNPTEATEGKVNFYVDTAYTEKQKNDPTAILAYWRQGDDLYLKSCATVRKEFPDLVRWIQSFVKENGYTSRSRIIVEPKASGLSVVQQLKQQTSLNVMKDTPPKDGKVARVNAVSAIIEAGRIHVPKGRGWVDPFLNECKVFPNGVHDDRVDCLVGAIQRELMRPKGKRRRAAFVRAD